MSTARRSNAKRRRQGIVLILVVSLLALFILLGITFALVASAHLSAAKVDREHQRVGDMPETEVDLVLQQIICDQLQGFNRSSLQGHSLLADLYGGDSVAQGFVGGPASRPPLPLPTNVDGLANGSLPSGATQAQVIKFTAVPSSIYQAASHYYSGRVITFRNGNAANHSTRILDYAYTPPDVPNNVPAKYEFFIEAIESKAGGFLVPQQGSEFIINGAPFNGAGAGYDSLSYNMDMFLSHVTLAAPPNPPTLPTTPPTTDLVSLLPHFSGYDFNNCRLVQGSGTYQQLMPMINFIYLAGPDESWDAVDIQNMFLAMVPPRAAESYYGGTKLPIIPSYHRPELVQFWLYQILSIPEIQTLGSGPNGPADQFKVIAQPYGPDGIRSSSGTEDDNLSVSADNRDRIYNITRGCIFRPMPWDHPYFTGSNSYFNGVPVTNANRSIDITNAQGLFTALINQNNLPIWDVDNDGDTIPDSIWIDPGLPVITSPDGHRYKRLAAILIKDLDGSIDLNAHGNLQQVEIINGTYAYRAEYQVPGATAPNNFGLLATPAYVPRGMGFGPAEVDFLNVFTTSTPAHNDPTALLAYRQLLWTKYSSTQTNDSGVNARPGVPGVRDPLNIVKHHGVPNDYGSGGTNGMWYASPPDVWGRGGVLLDVGGHSLSYFMGQTGDMLDNPYELSLSGQRNNTDSPYAAVELERLLRYHDPDAYHLPCRPLGVTGNYFSWDKPGVIGPSHHVRNMLAGMTSHIPAPSTTTPPEFRNALAGVIPSKTPGNTTILDLYTARLRNAGLAGAVLEQELQKVAPWEFFHGQKFDLNRWLGDGVDNNGDGVVDEPQEATAAAGETAWQGGPGNFPGTIAAHGNGFVTNNLARQLYARHLFCLAMLFLPDNFPSTYTGLPADTGIGANAPLASNRTPYRELIIRRIAQWAVNCVDFRDSDSSMTPFEFDYNPWDGWQVDGNPGTDGGTTAPENVPNLPAIQQTDYGLVWGMEYPELLITETLAFHDRRVKDTDKESMMGKKRTEMVVADRDDDLDQFRVPEGSLFFELYCPRGFTWSGQGTNQKPLTTADLYRNGALELGKRVLDVPAGRPVWRLALTQLLGPSANANQQQLQPGRMANTNPESASYEPYSPNLLPGQTPTGRVTIDRFAYFVNPTASLTPGELERSFYFNTNNPQTTTLLSPGQYAVIGPRATTYLGSQDPANANPAPATPNSLWGGNSPQYIQLGGASGVIVRDTAGTTTSRTAGTNTQPALALTCGMYGITPVTTAGQWMTKTPWNVGLNITEPLPIASGNYYKEPGFAGTPMGAAQADFYDDPDTTMAMGTFPDQPEDSPSVPTPAGRPIAEQSMTQSGTYLNAASVYLQRLANPNLAYNPLPNTDTYVPYNSNLPVNPYITVDWATIDVTVFSGEEDTTDPNKMPSPFDPDDDPTSARAMHFRTRQRGYMPNGMLNTTPPITTSNPWPPSTRNGTDFNGMALPQTTPGAQPGPYFKVDLSNNLDNTYAVSTDRHTLGYLNGTIDPNPLGSLGPGNRYMGEPGLAPFPWLAWHNRPFANPMELLVVPSSSPSRICSEITPGFPANGTLATSPYLAAGVAGASDDPLAFRTPFAHLLNFFESDDMRNAVGGGNAPHFYRILDYVEVPSPYAGAERWYNPQQFATVPTYLPPFNKMSRFRDPGRMNINTIFDTSIWDAAIAMFPGIRQSDKDTTIAPPNGIGFAERVFLSRQGDGGSVVGQMNPAYPTRFANPFRSADSADLMPNVANMRKTRPVDATLMRPDPALTTPNQQPLFQINPTNPTYSTWVDNGPQSTSQPDAAKPGQARDINRNPYFRYQALQKLGNTFTTQSNCFAVWITIGYFEVDEYRPVSLPSGAPGLVQIDAAHPDGLTLGQELGLDTGGVTRHRAFYILDRSIPVGFSPGSRLNSDDCILTRRLIE